MTFQTTALAWQIVAYDSRMTAAVRAGQVAEVALLQEVREEAAMDLFRAARHNWVPALRPMHPEAA